MVAEQFIQNLNGIFRNFTGIGMAGFILSMEGFMAVFVYSPCCLFGLYLVDAINKYLIAVKHYLALDHLLIEFIF